MGRGPAAALSQAGTDAEQDAVFFQKPPNDESQGELTVEGQRDYGSLAVRIDQAVAETSVREQGILELWESLSERQSLMSGTPSIKPARGWFTSKFGYRVSPFTGRPVMHNGLDIAAPPGSPISAPADGVVSFAGYDPGYGKLVSIDHGYGVVTRFGHTSQIFVEVGQKIHRRDVIAAVGNTGRSTGPHCHYEVRVNGVPVDPQNYILDE
jgi:murein DD-endopeptidase MepM/ murein hydrolase activator NlpD